MRLPYFPGSRVAWDSSTFLKIDLTNINYYLYFFSLTLKMLNPPNFLSAASEARSLNFHARCETFLSASWHESFFLDWLDFLLINFYSFCFFFSITDSSFAFFFIFATWFWLSSAFLLTLMLLLHQALEILDGSPAWKQAGSSSFPCEAWTKNLHGKTPHPLFDSLPFAFSWNYAPSPTFHAFTPEQASQSLSRRTFPASASLKLLSPEWNFHFPWIFFWGIRFFCRYPFFLCVLCFYFSSPSLLFAFIYFLRLRFFASFSHFFAFLCFFRISYAFLRKASCDFFYFCIFH